MRIDVITVLPEMLEGFINESILLRAQEKGLAEIHLHHLRDYTTDKWRRMDDYPYGDFAGMVIQYKPIDRCITALKAEREYGEVIFTSPDGEQFDQQVANDLSMKNNIIILCGHYKSIDQRIHDHLITREINIGDYVLTGGKLTAAVMANAIIHLVPGVISDEQSALSDSFQDSMLSTPIYTHPASYEGWKIPEILLNGNEARIKNWEMEQALERTRRLRPDLLGGTPHNPQVHDWQTIKAILSLKPMTKFIEKPQPSFPEAVRKGCNRLFDFHGRTRRSDFWWFILAYMVCYFILTNICKAFLPLLAAAICDLAVLSLALAITMRRLQDRGASKWWVYASYASTVVYTLYIYGTGIGEGLMSINANPEASMGMFADPIFIISLIVVMVAGLVTFVLCLLDGKPQPNKYGPSPKYIIQEETTHEQRLEATA